MNCRGVGKKGFSFCLRDLIYEHQFDFIGLQETMKRKVDSSVWRKFDLDNSYNWLWSPFVGHSGGILCGIKSSRFNVITFFVGRFFVKARVSDLKFQKEYWLIIVYGAAQDEDKDLFLQTFSDICENLDIPSLIGGDFNILRFANEKNKGGGVTRFSDEFNSIINKFALRELPLSGGMFTW
jgi:exonuclease III